MSDECKDGEVYSQIWAEKERTVATETQRIQDGFQGEVTSISHPEEEKTKERSY